MNIVRRVIDALRAYFQPRAPETETSDRLPSNVSIRGFNSEYVNFRENLISTTLGLTVTSADYFFIDYFTLDGTKKTTFCYIYDDISILKVGNNKIIVSMLGISDANCIPDNAYVSNIENFPKSESEIKAFAISVQEVKNEWDVVGYGVTLDISMSEAEHINNKVLERIINIPQTSESIKDILDNATSERKVVKRFDL